MLYGYSLLTKCKNSNSYLNPGVRKTLFLHWLHDYKTHGFDWEFCKYDHSKRYWLSLSHSQSFLIRKNFSCLVRQHRRAYAFSSLPGSYLSLSYTVLAQEITTVRVRIFRITFKMKKWTIDWPLPQG